MAYDLNRHAQRYKWNGFPIYGRWEDGEEGEQIGIIVEPLWQWADMNEADRATVQSHSVAMRADTRAADLTDDYVFYLACGDFAIACPHFHWAYHEPTHRECRGCQVWEQLHGRVVMVGDERMRVSDPPPRLLRIPRPVKLTYESFTALPSLSPSFEVDEYEWTGCAYQRLTT